MTSRARKLSSRLLSLLLATVWGGLILLGAASMARCRTVPAAAKATACVVCHCTMCRTLHSGGMARCCCHPSPTPAPQARLCACCDQGHPGNAAAFIWWPLAVPPSNSAFAVTLSRAEAFRHLPQAAASLRRTPPSRPPQLL